ncbi:MAG: hypothetical protein HY900_18010 [Deltaproteobacteria bacterium]|nr:hypothetical protein [Deltaproteobacteria bacterium]
MDPAAGRQEGAGLLRFFGLETGEKALTVLCWTIPYLALLALGFAGLSYLVQLITPLPVWVYVVASALGLLYFFLFLARMRQMGSEAQARSEAEEAEKP